MIKHIVSPQNTLIKDLLKLREKPRERKKQGLFLLEGKREILLAIQGNYLIKTVLYFEKYCSLSAIKSCISEVTEIIEISKEVYQKLAYRDTTEGMIAVVASKEFALKDIQFQHEHPLILVAEGIEKPGNIGAILRTADAANVDAVFIANPKTDLYNANVIRSSVGCLFTNQIALGTSEEIIDFLHKKNVDIYSATLQNSNAYYKENFEKASAIVVGTEATGLTDAWRKVATQHINIPMQGEIDSMNVSVAAAIILFEAKRQRNFS